jgi:NADH-quinone oxidoreductase subunit C
VSEAGDLIEATTPGAVLEEIEERGELTLVVAKDQLLPVARFLQGPPLSYVLLSDVTCADYPEHPDRFRLAYQLTSIESGTFLRLRVWAGARDPEVPSVTPVWKTANWLEREVFDLFGVRFEGHPDLCRILMPLDWEGHPLRRDYPIGGEEVEFSHHVLGGGDTMRTRPDA